MIKRARAYLSILIIYECAYACACACRSRLRPLVFRDGTKLQNDYEIFYLRLWYYIWIAQFSALIQNDTVDTIQCVAFIHELKFNRSFIHTEANQCMHIYLTYKFVHPNLTNNFLNEFHQMKMCPQRRINRKKNCMSMQSFININTNTQI